MALESNDLYLVNRAGTDYRVEYGAIKDDILGSVELPDGSPAVPTLENVLEVGNLAKPGQGIRFRVNKGDLPPTAKEVYEVEGGAGLRLGGVVSYYSLNEPFTLDTDNGATAFAFSTRRMTAVDDYYYAGDDLGNSFSAGFGLTGINYNSDYCQIDINSGGVLIRHGTYENPSLKISSSTYEGKSSIKADEFIGDGSKLTGVKAGIDWDSLPELT